MKIKKIFTTSIIGTSIIFSLNGCVNKNSITIKNDNLSRENNFYKYNNTKHIIGDKQKSIKTLKYIEKYNNKVNTSITFYIDKFPYEKKFDLCKDMKNNKILSSIQKDNNNNEKLIFKENPINCNGYIFITKFNNNLFGSVKMKLLEGFNIHKLNGHEILLKKQKTISIKNTLFRDHITNINYFTKTKIEKLWIEK